MTVLEATAVVMEAPGELALRRLSLVPPGPADAIVDVAWSGISTGTERLLWSGRMPPFPGLGYPLVPGYESVGRVVEVGAQAGLRVGDTVFVPGSSGFRDARGLFGGAASRVVAAGARLVRLDAGLRENGVLLALAATAQHAISAGRQVPELIVGHGVLGRLLARLVIAAGHEPPTVWEIDPARQGGADGYAVVRPEADTRRDYACICDASGDPAILDILVGHLAKGGEIVLAGFYERPLSFAFPPAFMRHLRLTVAAEWAPRDLDAVMLALDDGRLSLDGLVTHRSDAAAADTAYRTAFGDAACLKMILDWEGCA